MKALKQSGFNFICLNIEKPYVELQKFQKAKKKKEKERNPCAFKPKPNVVLKKPQRCFYSMCHMETEHHVLEVLVDTHNVLLACYS